jgi:ribonuclease HI
MEIRDEGWSPPPETTIKINWDASLDKIRRIVGMGMIARDGQGSVIAAATKVLFLEADPVVAEFLATTHALIFCHELGLQHVIIEGDAQQVVNAINSDRPCNTSYGHLIEDIRVSLGSSCFQYVRRTANLAAHALAVEARTRVTDKMWFSIPPCISDIVRKEEDNSSP